MLETKSCVGNLFTSITQDDLHALFSQARDVTSIDMIKDRKSVESNGFAFITRSA